MGSLPPLYFFPFLFLCLYKQQYAATSAFLNEKPLLLFPNTKILLNLITLCKTEQPFCKYRICSIFSLYAANMQQYAATCSFFVKKTTFNIPKYKNITPLQKI